NFTAKCAEQRKGFYRASILIMKVTSPEVFFRSSRSAIVFFGELSALRALCGKKEVAILTLPQSALSNAKDFIEQAF
uniref:hypothetical protein n=2 Tax=Roseivirga sp. TaxID=1964215 RepID=UPI00404734CA